MEETFMKILVVTRSLDQRVGGLENHTIQMCRGLQRFGWDITIITPNLKQNVPSTIHDNFNIQRLGKAPSDLLKYSPRLWRKISKFIKRNSDDFDVIINVGMALGGAFRLTNSQKNKLITIDHGTYALERKTLYSQIKMNKFEIKLWLGIPYTYIFQQIERGVINRSRFVIAVSDNIANDLRKRYELNNEKLYTIYNAVDTKYFKYKKRDFNNFSQGTSTKRNLLFGRFIHTIK
jgi:glycosyltransferase involved in cell wall biosynthesis